MECDSWNKDVLRGILVDYKEGNELLLGNHNYCRNPGGIEVRTNILYLNVICSLVSQLNSLLVFIFLKPKFQL